MTPNRRSLAMLGKKNAKKHGHSCDGGTSPTYRVWRSVIQRCEDPGATVYDYYGGRGIKVCKRWRESFDAFLADMGERPPGHTIDRKNTNGDYTPTNCRWATRKQQARNRRSSRMMTANGITMTQVEWCEKLGCDRSAINRRIKKGMTEEEALTTPFRRRSK